MRQPHRYFAAGYRLAATGDERPCLLEWKTLAPHRLYRLTARLEGLDDLTVESRDCFEAMRQVRSRLEEAGLKLCCNGARTDAWASWMQRDIIDRDFLGPAADLLS